jgi:hypothetical protein
MKTRLLIIIGMIISIIISVFSLIIIDNIEPQSKFLLIRDDPNAPDELRAIIELCQKPWGDRGMYQKYRNQTHQLGTHTCEWELLDQNKIEKDSESLNKKWGELYIEYQLLKESFLDYPNNMTTIERMAEIDDETMRIATILSEREFTIDVPGMSNGNVTFDDPVYPVSDWNIDFESDFEVQREIAKQIYKSLPKDDDSPYLGMILGENRKSIQFGIDITKLTPEKNKEYYEKLFEEKFSEVISYNVVFKERQGGDE